MSAYIARQTRHRHLLPGRSRHRTSPTAAMPEVMSTPSPKGDRPYAHPYYWAAFFLIGDPDRFRPTCFGDLERRYSADCRRRTLPIDGN